SAPRKPEGQIQQDSGKVTRFGHPKQKAHYVELVHGPHKGGQGSHNPPHNQDSSNPEASPNFVQDQVARNLEKGIADKEHPNHESKLLAGDAQLVVHGECSKSNIDAIEKCNDVEEQ